MKSRKRGLSPMPPASPGPRASTSAAGEALTLGVRKRPAAAGVKVVTGVAVLLWAFSGLTPALADTIEAALVRAYQNNPQLNAQRASVRATDARCALSCGLF